MTTLRGGGAFKPTYAALEAAYPRKSMTSGALFDELGIAELKNNVNYVNTCAIRMSYALARAGVVLRKGGLKYNRGPYKGMKIDPSMQTLAAHLAELWGAPEKYDSQAAAQIALNLRKGVVAFFFGERLPIVGAFGHIDLLQPKPSGIFECVETCFFSPKNKVWFWPLA
jgi:hypothetical protein